MKKDRLPKLRKSYKPHGIRKWEQSVTRLLDKWGWNRTGGLAHWLPDNDDDDWWWWWGGGAASKPNSELSEHKWKYEVYWYSKKLSFIIFMFHVCNIFF